MSQNQQLDLETQIRQEEMASRNAVYEWAEALLVALAIAAIVTSCLFRVVTVSGNSMRNTLQNGDTLLVVSGFYHQPQYGDIVVVNRNAEEPLIKRVIACEGDTVDIDPDSGVVYLNGEVLEEPYLQCETPVLDFEGPYTVPAGYVFVMGDNRGDSWDSRSIGAVSEEDVMGKAVFRMMPFSRVGTIS